MKKIILLFIFFLFNNTCLAIENIEVNNESLIPLYNKTTKVYNVYTNINKEIITINVTESLGETITGSGSKTLKKGTNYFEINSYIDGILSNTYKLYITRGIDIFDKSDSSLSSLDIYGLTTCFKSDKYNYNIDITNKLNNNIKYETTNPNSKVYLNIYNNYINIKVISEDLTSTTNYKINIINPNIKENKLTNNTNKEYTSFDLKLIRITIITSYIIIISILFYIIFLKKKKI